MSRLFATSLALVVFGCWGPPAEGRLTCGPAGECPSGWYCHTGNRCWSTPADAHVDAPRDATSADVPTDAFDDPGDGMTVAYVVSRLDAPEPTAMMVPGFDLDGAPGMTGSRCDERAPDLTSSVTGAPNVDNQLGANFAPILDAAITGGFAVGVRRRIATGSYLIVLQLTDVDDYTSDGRVGALFVRAGLPAGTSTPMLDGVGELSPGQAFDQRGVFWRGDLAIVDGRVSWSSEALPLELDRGDGVQAGFILRDVRWAADVSASGLTRGEIGGRIDFRDLVAFTAESGLGVDEMTVRGIAMPDLVPNSDGSRCDGVSAGFSFSAVSAMLF
jgi:hypothetical protein